MLLNNQLLAKYFFMNTTSKLLFAFTALLFLGCGNDQSALLNQLEGTWEVAEARRNNKRTSTLEGAYFSFSDTNTIRTNISGKEETLSFDLDGQIIQQEGGTFEVDYTIENITDSTLEMTTEIRNFPFRFILKKTNSES